MPASNLRTETLRDARAFVQHWNEIATLRQEEAVEDDVLLDPVHFLATTDETRRSCSVACWDGLELIGIVYATCHYVRGVNTGYAVGGDFAGRGLILCRAEHEPEVMQASIAHMAASGTHSIHLRLLPRNEDKAAVKGMAMRYLDALIPGDRLLLLPTFEEFLGTLGKHTRRNVRYYTRKVLAEGIEFIPALTKAEYQAGLDRLNAITSFPAEPLRLARDERLLELHSGAQRFGLRAADGNLVAVLCGFTRNGRYHLLTQLNDIHLEHLSLSLVLRGCVIEHLIGSGHTQLQFMGGTSLSFGRFCVPQQYRSIFVDKKSGISAAAKQLGGTMVKLSLMLGRPVPKQLEMLCNGILDESRLVDRTALGPAAVAFAKEHSS
jgi:hypothetical protein